MAIRRTNGPGGPVKPMSTASKTAKKGTSVLTSVTKTAASQAAAKAAAQKAAAAKNAAATKTTVKKPSTATKPTVKTTPGATVSAQAPAFGFVAQSHRYGTDTKKASEAYERSISKTKMPSDSAKYFSTLKTISPKMGAANQAEMSRVYKTTKKTFPNATAQYDVVKGVPRMTIKYNTPVSKMTPQQKAAYQKIYGGQYSGQSLKKTMGQK